MMEQLVIVLGALLCFLVLLLIGQATSDEKTFLTELFEFLENRNKERKKEALIELLGLRALPKQSAIDRMMNITDSRISYQIERIDNLIIRVSELEDRLAEKEKSKRKL